MNGKADERDDDGDTQVFYRFGREASLGTGPADPRWDSTDAGQGSTPTGGTPTGSTPTGGGHTGAGLPQRHPDPAQTELPTWNAFGRAPEDSSFTELPTSGTELTPHEVAARETGYRPSPFRRYSEPTAGTDLWGGEEAENTGGWATDPEQQRWNGLAGHDDRPAWTDDAQPAWGGLAGHDDRPPWRPGQSDEPTWGGGERWTGGGQPDSPSGDLVAVGAGRAIEPAPRGREVELSRRRSPRRAALGEDERPRKGRGRGRRNMPLWQELPLLLVVAFCLAVLIRTFLLQAFYIPSGSMEQTLLVGDRVLVNKIVYDVRTPQRGEVVVFSGPSNWAPENIADPDEGMLSKVGGTLGDLVGVSRPGEKDFIKRVIGLPGDRVSCCDPDGRVYVNGVGIDEPYVDNNSPLDVPPDPRVCRSRRFDEVLVPPGQIFVMGDHRIVSQDSRCQGTVPIDNVIGRAFVIVWPSSRWAGLGVPDTFSKVPGPVALGAPDLAVPGAPAIGAAAITLPLVASLVKTSRTRRKRRRGRRTLPT